MKHFIILAAGLLGYAGAALAGMQSSVTQYGITWTFDKEYEVGQFCNGDYWVVGPFNVTDISNTYHTHGFAPVAGQDGSMLAPGTDKKQGYESSLSTYDASLNVDKGGISAGSPLTVPAGQSLVSQVSWLYTDQSNTEPGCPSFNNGTGTPRPATRVGAVLTSVASVPAAGSFRPGYCGTGNTVKHNKSDLDYSLLMNLDLPPVVPNLDTLERNLERPWIDHVNNFMSGYTHPSENMEQYGQYMASEMGEVAAALHLDFSKLPGSPSKETLLIRMVQLGIDLKGIVDNGGFWPNNGGHMAGRKWPILFAGLMLDDAGMKAIGEKSGDYLYSNGHSAGDEPDDYLHFGEDDQTFYVKDKDILPEPYEEFTSGSFTWYGHGNGGKKKDYKEYTAVHKGLPDWGINHSNGWMKDGLTWDASYRLCCTGICWGGFALAAHIMNAKELWNHNAFFDYTDRYIEIQTAFNAGNRIQDSYFSLSMWNTYRTQFGGTWTRSTPSDTFSQGTLDYSECVYHCEPVRISSRNRADDSGTGIIPSPVSLHELRQLYPDAQIMHMDGSSAENRTGMFILRISDERYHKVMVIH